MILLLGANGHVGTAYQKFFSSKNVVFKPLTRGMADFSKREILRKVLRDVKPDFVINAAGYAGRPNVDAAEDHKLDCLEANTVLPVMIAEVCAEEKVPWGHVSSGCIFTGNGPKGKGFSETDTPNFTFRQNNCSFYSGTKALAEEMLAGASNGYLWRLRIPFNEIDHARNYLTKVMRYDHLLDVRNSLSQLDEFVQATWECWIKKVPWGIYNLTNPGSVTTREVVELIKKSGVCNKEFHFFKSEAEFMKLAAKTPRSNCVLDTTKLQKTGIKMTDVHEAIQIALTNWKRI